MVAVPTYQKRVIAGATGFIGRALVRGWIAQGLDLTVVGRSKEKICDVFNHKVRGVTWQEFKKGEVDPKDLDCVVNLSGAGIAAQRWTPARKKEILNSRLAPTQAVTEYCVKNKIPLLNASAVGIYPSQEIIKDGLPPAWDEDSLSPKEAAEHFLSSVCRHWEGAAQPLRKAGVRTVFLRFGVVLDKGSETLKKMAVPFYFFIGGPIGSGKQVIAWISLDDLCRAVDFIIEHKHINGPVNLVAPRCVTQKDFARALGKALGKPSFVPIPGFILKMVLGDMAQELLLSGQHVYPKRLLDGGFKFKHAAIEQALKDMYG